MRFTTHIAGAAVAAMVAMTAIPNDAAALPGTFGFVPVGDVVFGLVAGGTTTDIVDAALIASKFYPDSFVNQAGDGIFAGVTALNPGGLPPGAITFDLPPGVDFTITTNTGYILHFDTGTVEPGSVATGAGTVGALIVNYTGEIAAGSPGDVGQSVLLSQSCDQSDLAAPVNCSNTVTTPAPTIPEPASLALLGSALVGLGGLGLFRRRRNAA